MCILVLGTSFYVRQFSQTIFLEVFHVESIVNFSVLSQLFKISYLPYLAKTLVVQPSTSLLF